MALKKMIHDFGMKEIAPIMAEYDRIGKVPEAAVKKGFEIGLHLLGTPEAYGGLGLNIYDSCIIKEELGAVDVGFETIFGAAELASSLISRIGTEEQKRYYFDFISKNKLSAFCLTEPQAGSDAAAVRTTAVKDGDYYILNGSKCFITNGGIADIFLVVASTDKSKGFKGLSTFIVERSLGVKSGKDEDKMGIRLSNTADVIFEDVRVHKSMLLGEEGTGFLNAMKSLGLGRISVAAIATGTIRRALELATQYAKERTTFGKPIASNQSIAFMLADMKIAEETARQMYQYAARLADAGLPFQLEGSVAKTYASDCAMQAAINAVQIFGGYGYSREYPVEKLMRDAKILQIFEGTNQIQRVIISKKLLG